MPTPELAIRLIKRARWFAIIAAFVLTFVYAAEPAMADPVEPLVVETTSETKELSAPDIAWMLVCSALVLMMTAPGLALFYGGLVRKKNILSVMMQCIFLMGLMTLVWVAWGYSFAFGGDNPWIGNFDHVFLIGVTPYFDAELNQVVTPASGTIPDSLFAVFQGMFFIITPALICGAFAERMKFSTMCVFMVLWGTLIYCPIAHWVWSGNGWLCEANPNALFPALDFAGGSVVHISSGVSALVCSIMVGKRLGFGKESMPPHNLTYTCIGAALLWVGWFGFNAGSSLSAGTGAVNAFVSTHFAAAAGVVGWCVCEWMLRKKASLLGACSGAVAGLVGVTPASGSATALGGIVIGLIAGVVCFLACTALKNRLGYDDSLDAFGVHGIGGTVGALLTGVFASKSIVGPKGTAGMLEGNLYQIVPQLVSVVAAAGISVIGTIVILKILDAVMGLRVTEEEERQGLDINQHGEEGYIFM
ncbi:MAG: ammonium transporter [Planctomycetota bacterium]